MEPKNYQSEYLYICGSIGNVAWCTHFETKCALQIISVAPSLFKTMEFGNEIAFIELTLNMNYVLDILGNVWTWNIKNDEILPVENIPVIVSMGRINNTILLVGNDGLLYKIGAKIQNSTDSLLYHIWKDLSNYKDRFIVKIICNKFYIFIICKNGEILAAQIDDNCYSYSRAFRRTDAPIFEICSESNVVFISSTSNLFNFTLENEKILCFKDPFIKCISDDIVDIGYSWFFDNNQNIFHYNKEGLSEITCKTNNFISSEYLIFAAAIDEKMF